MTEICTCPCCGQDAERVYWLGDCFLEEEHINCDCGYTYSYTYGYYLEQKPDEPLTAWSHLDPIKRVVEM